MGDILRTVLLACALVFAADARAQDAAHEPGSEGRDETFEPRIVGNELLLDPVIEAVLELPASAEASAEIAELAETQLRHYFFETGFELARVEVVAYGGELWIFVDEGALDRVFFAGAGTAKTAQMQLEFELPNDVYNRLHLERELERLRKKHGLRELEAELVAEPVEAPPNLRRQLIAALQSGEDEAEQVWRRAGGRFSLRVTAVGREWGSGLEIGASLIGPYGLEGSVGYLGTDLFLFADRYSVEVELGGLSEHLFTGASAEIFYATPELIGESVRPAVDVDARLDNLERDSLDLHLYLYLQSNAVVLVGFEPLTDLVVAPGVGYGYDHLISVDRGSRTPKYVAPQRRNYLVGEIGVEWLISRIGFRRDKLHLLEAVLQVRPSDEQLWGRIEGDYQKAWALGDHDLFLRSNFFSFAGSAVQWYDEDPIASQVMRAVAGEHEFARHLLALGTEYRHAIHEELVKAGLSASAAAAGLQDRQTREHFPEVLAAAGPGLHIQLLGNFQLNLFYHMGWRGDGSTDGRFSLRFWKVY